jgi:hypothetical protein
MNVHRQHEYHFAQEHHSSVAQPVEQVAVNHLVGGSNPSRGAKIEAVDCSG